MEGLLSQFSEKHNRAKIFSETKIQCYGEKRRRRNCKMDRNPGAPPLYAQLEQILETADRMRHVQKEIFCQQKKS